MIRQITLFLILYSCVGASLAQDSAWKTFCNNSSDEDILKNMLANAKLE